VSTSMTINSTAGILLCLYVAVAKKQGADLKKLSGTTQNDILKEYIARGTYIYPLQHAMRIITDIFGWCREALPKWNTISISGYHIREAGSTAVQEVAFTLAAGIAYVEAALRAGLAMDEFAAVLGGCQSLHTNSMDEALSLPTEDAALIALRTLQIIANETGVANAIDPVAGSYAIESLTDQIEARAQEYLAKIDALGGMIKA